MIRIMASSRWSVLRRRRDSGPGAKNKTSYEKKNQNLAAPWRSPASRWSALRRWPTNYIPRKETRISESCSLGLPAKAFNRKEQTLQSAVVNGRISGSLTIGNGNPFQAHSV